MRNLNLVNRVLPLTGLPEFAGRHIGPRPPEIQRMLQTLELDSLESLIETAIPAPIRTERVLDLPSARSESAVLSDLREMMSMNLVTRSYIGRGYSPTITPPPIQRLVLENPGWYTQYTPYQAEISQGRLEVLFYFQSMVCDLTGLEVANASLLDEGTAAAEAAALAYSLKGNSKKNTLLLIEGCHPQTEAVVRTRAAALGIAVESSSRDGLTDREDVFAILAQYPSTTGEIYPLSPLTEAAHQIGALAIVAADLLPMTVLQPPGEAGADIVVGSTQPFGIPLGYGGPHAAYFATRDKFKRKLPGRVIGVSKDSQGNAAYRLALQTREQHIRREKATSNICTAQALLANMAALYAIYHGPEGLKQIANRIHQQTVWLAKQLADAGFQIRHEHFFDTLVIEVDAQQKQAVLERARERKINLRTEDLDGIGLSLNETVTEADLTELLAIFDTASSSESLTFEQVSSETSDFSSTVIAASDYRQTPFLTDPVFHRYRSETELMRFIKKLEAKDLSLTSSMIPLGSCTMKLNAAMEMQALSWEEVHSLHPFCPPEEAKGYAELFRQLELWLANITGFDAVSLQPNAGSQGEYAGLLAIKAFHAQQQSGNRNICLIPQSAHGTNPASAAMAGFKVVPVRCDENGNIDIAHLEEQANKHSDSLGALMITYPSTHGVFEEGVKRITQVIHDHGGQVYLDGANLNAQVGFCTPGEIGADVCHLNLHKTFCIPHGGGGPGVGPIAVKSHLAPFLPSLDETTPLDSTVVGPVAAAPYGSASILTISWSYIAAMGAPGLTAATAVAILNANYIAKRLEPFFPVLYRGEGGLVAHECIIDLRAFASVTVEDVAKRLMDYGFHAPTISWPVAGTMMIEPTESESLGELDRFCDAMESIHGEIQAIESNAVDPQDNLLKNAPHTAEMIAASDWAHPYSREEAAFPLDYLRGDKFWPSVGRIDNVFGDRNPICTCQGMESFDAS